MTREEAIARARKWNLGSLDEEDTTALYELIPELRESKDERTRKEIIHYILELEKEYKTWWRSITGKINIEHTMEWYMHETARHFYELGLNARRED